MKTKLDVDLVDVEIIGLQKMLHCLPFVWSLWQVRRSNLANGASSIAGEIAVVAKMIWTPQAIIRPALQSIQFSELSVSTANYSDIYNY
jgi:hypothetical protein